MSYNTDIEGQPGVPAQFNQQLSQSQSQIKTPYHPPYHPPYRSNQSQQSQQSQHINQFKKPKKTQKEKEKGKENEKKQQSTNFPVIETDQEIVDKKLSLEILKHNFSKNIEYTIVTKKYDEKREKYVTKYRGLFIIHWKRNMVKREMDNKLFLCDKKYNGYVKQFMAGDPIWFEVEPNTQTEFDCVYDQLDIATKIKSVKDMRIEDKIR